MFLYKLVNDKFDCSVLLARISLNIPSKIPRYPIVKPYHIQHCNTNIGVNSPLNRMCREVNSFIKLVPNADMHHDSMNTFKSKILESRTENVTT